MSKFYEEFQKNNFFEKEASENENVKNTLSGLSPEVLEKIASELDAISTINEGSLEAKLAAENDDEEEKESECGEDKDKEEKESACGEEKDKEEKESACGEEKDKEEKESSDDPEKDKQDEVRKSVDDESDEDKDKEEKESSDDEEKDKEEKESSDDPEKDKQDEIKKQAYELAEEKLASQGLGVYDYVCQKVGDEKIAAFITENAEKLAFLSDSPALQYADEIISCVNEKLG